MPVNLTKILTYYMRAAYTHEFANDESKAPFAI